MTITAKVIFFDIGATLATAIPGDTPGSIKGFALLSEAVAMLEAAHRSGARLAIISNAGEFPVSSSSRYSTTQGLHVCQTTPSSRRTDMAASATVASSASWSKRRSSAAWLRVVGGEGFAVDANLIRADANR